MGGRGASGLSASRSEFSGSDRNYEEISSIIKDTDFRYFGIRVSVEQRRVGDYFNLSEDMSEYSENYGKKLDGTSTIGLNIDRYSDADEIKSEVQSALKKATAYEGSHISIVGGRYGDYGDDPGELVISDPTLRRRRGARMLYKIK